MHLSTEDTPKNFDLKTIWSVGEKFDSHLNKPVNSLVTLFNEHSFCLDNLELVDFNHVNPDLFVAVHSVKCKLSFEYCI